jgi:hypothetical protein
MNYKINDKIKWNGIFSNGYQEGTNIIIEIFEDVGYKWVCLDNNKTFMIENLKHPNKSVPKIWEPNLIKGIS